MNYKRVHFIGIGGTGLSAIAQVLMERGTKISGSDRQLSPLAEHLQAAGAVVRIGHAAENVHGADIVIRSSAIPDDNVEVQAARAAGIPVLKRSEFLGQFFAASKQQVIAIAGTHGKTTTTSMVAWMLRSLGIDPSFVIGSTSKDLAGNAHSGEDPYFVIEADEYDHMFLGLNPWLAVVTNIEHDHPDCYPTPEDFYQAFVDFARSLQAGGMLIACADDPGAQRLLHESCMTSVNTACYGISNPDCDYRAANLMANPQSGFSFDVFLRNSPSTPAAKVALRVPGVHNVRNALAALAAADRMGLCLPAAAAALGTFTGAGRRFELRGIAAGVSVIDDYAHHPTEIRATLSAARAHYPNHTIWAIWQPHTYSRLRALFDDFAAAFEQADHVLVTDIYAAREAQPTNGFSSRQIVAAIREHSAAGAVYTPALTDASDYLAANLKSGDVVIVLSAGDANAICTQVLERLVG